MIFSVTTLDYKITVFLYAWAFLLNLHSSAFHSRSHWRYVCRRQTRERLFKLRATRELNTFSCKWRSVAKQQQALKRLAIHIINTRENWLLFSESIFKRQGLKWGWLLRYRSFVSSQIEKKKKFFHSFCLVQPSFLLLHPSLLIQYVLSTFSSGNAGKKEK